MKKKLLALLMSVVLLVPALPVTAADSDATIVTKSVTYDAGATGFIAGANGDVLLYLNGAWASNYSGLYNDPACGWWVIKNGKVDFTYTDLYHDPVVGWWKVTNGTIDFSFTGLYDSPTMGSWYVIGGMLDVARGCQAPPKTSEVTKNTLNCALHSQAEIRAFVQNHPYTLQFQGYSATPSVTAPYNMGWITTAEQNSALNAMNCIRYVAGISSNITLDYSYCEKAQAASLVCAANGALSHSPSRPAGMDDYNYDLGRYGAGSCNLAAGFSSLASSLINGWMHDGDASNIDRVGHRRWVLNPSMQKTGFGYVNGRSGYSSFSAMYAFDSSAGNSSVQVAWPAQNMPVEFMSSSTPWSFTVGVPLDKATCSVSLTNLTTGQKWGFSPASSNGYFNVENSNYGMPGCIIFRPDTTMTYQPGDLYEVVIVANGVTYKYQVSFFSL